MENSSEVLSSEILKFLSPFGEKAGRFIYTTSSRNGLINYFANKNGMTVVTPEIKNAVEQKLKNAWQSILVERRKTFIE